MKILMLSTDENIFIEGSEVRQRMIDYGSLVEELHIIVKSHRSRVVTQTPSNVFVYLADSYWTAYQVGRGVVSRLLITDYSLLITTQDPFETGLVGYLLKRKFRLPLQLQIHTDFLSPFFHGESLRNRFRVLLAKWLVKKADGIRVVSECIKNSLVASGYDLGSTDVLPIFVDTEKIKNAPVKTDLRQKYPGRFIILMASRLTKEKNIGLAIKAIKNLIPNYRNILLLVVGSGPEREALKLQITNYKLQNNVVIENWCNDLPSYYKTADLFLLTSNYEGYGRTVVEATAAGLPVLMTDVGVAIGEVVPVGDGKVLINSLDLLLSSRSEREKILEDQKEVLRLYSSNEDYLNKIRQSWVNCFL